MEREAPTGMRLCQVISMLGEGRVSWTVCESSLTISHSEQVKVRRDPPAMGCGAPGVATSR